MDIENINITKTIYDGLYIFLDMKNSYISNYKISDIKVLIREKSINFYFILFKYILKNTFYLYQIPLLQKSRSKILQIIKNNSETISNTYINNNKFKYIIDFFTDSKYYCEKYIKYSIDNQKQEEQIKSIKNNDLSISSSKGIVSTKTETKKSKI